MRARRRAVAAIAFVSAVTASGLLTACGPTAGGSAAVTPGPASSASGSSAPSAQPTPGGSAGSGTGGSGSTGGSTGGGGATVAPVALNGTGGGRLTISNGTSHVLMNGTSVDFGVVVRDLAWSPDGSRAAFIDGSGNLDVANPDGSGRITVAHNPGGQIWSHPAWQVTAADPQYGYPRRDNLFFVANTGGVTRLMQVKATQSGGTPTSLQLDSESGAGVTPLPTTGNTWVNGGGSHGEAVYANTGNGEVYFRDDYLRQQGGAVVNGSEPAMLPGDTGGIVFVRSVGGHDHVFLDKENTQTPTLVDLTPNATTDYTEPAVSPDGRTVAVRTPNGVAVVPLDGSAAPRLVSTTPGLPAYR
jgi:hypothetical protein